MSGVGLVFENLCARRDIVRVGSGILIFLFELSRQCWMAWLTMEAWSEVPVRAGGAAQLGLFRVGLAVQGFSTPG